MAKPLKIGIVGLGRASDLILPALADSPLATLAGAADLRPEARQEFQQTYDAPAFASLDELLKADIDAVWVATPNERHAEHAVAVARAGKHVMCEKPMAITLADCDAMIAAARAAGVTLMLGQSKVSQAPVQKMREVIAGGEIGEVLQISSWNYNDWLQRPRLSFEVDTARGGGICYRQAPHHVDIVRHLMGRPATGVRATVNRADPGFPTEGNYSALVQFEGGVAASLVYNAYGYFDISELTWDIGEGGDVRTPIAERKPKPRLTGPIDTEVRYGSGRRLDRGQRGRAQPFYGLTIASCTKGVIRQSPEGLYVYDANGRREVLCGTGSSILRDVAELAASIAENRAPHPDGHWGRATVEVCLGILESSRTGREIALRHQTAAP